MKDIITDTITITDTKKQHVIIIIPTYNEGETLGQTIDNLNIIISKITDFSVDILVFDSKSQDNTVNIVKIAQKQYKNIHLREEPQKTGLGSAYTQAMQIAMDELNADIIFEFDADGSHQPKYIPEMLDKIKQGADVVVGSRYVKGGTMPKDWGFHRKLLSWGGNIIARSVLSPKYRDLTSGFRASKTSFLRKIDLNKILSKDYAYKLHIFWALHELGAKIIEHPIDFIDREHGQSKLPKNSIKDSLRVVFTLRLRKLKRFIKMGFIGASSAVLQIAIFNLLRLEIPLTLATLISIECAVLNNFLLNNWITFKDNKISRRERKKLLSKFIQFNIASIGSIVIQTSLVKLSTIFFSGRHLLAENISMIAGIGIGAVLNYFIYSRVIWKINKKKQIKL